ncbi:MAG: dTDP-4-dehydrorhamnose reductase [Actinomycetota bacterium]|nr:dTDP-4-dehydrorhamnose reductase [Actinomycetota bacterium]
MRVLVAGAAGMLGQDVVDACVERHHEVFAFGRRELDITDPLDCEDALNEIRPDAVVNCAAWTDVDGAEADEAGAMRVNDTGAAHLAGAASNVGAKVVYISSDYVFDGEAHRPYTESSLTGPISAYGRSKAAGETSTAVANERHLIVRSSWLFGTRGHNFVETMLRAASRQPEVIVVSDQVGVPTFTRHLASALADLLPSEEFGVHHVVASGQCSWFDFAQEIFDQAGSECRVMAGTTEMLGRPAPRPAYSLLASERANAPVLPKWQRGLREYLFERGQPG